MQLIKNLLVNLFQNEYITSIKTKALSEVGGFTGIGLSIIIHWNDIFTKVLETGIITIVGGFCGALGGLLFAITKKKITKYLEQKELKEALEKELEELKELL